MYQEFFGLKAFPFELTPNPRYLLLTRSHREALSTIEYAIRARKAITLVVGEAGTGKSTLLRRALATKLASGVASGVDCVYISNPMLTRRDFFERLAFDFGLPANVIDSKTLLLRQLEQTLVARRAGGRLATLIVDEAQCIPDGLIEELRLLANIESDEEKLLPLILAGQPEIAHRLNEDRFRQFKQRIVMRCHLDTFDLHETAGYIFGRVRLVDGDAARLFTREAVMAVHRLSKGIPRTINVICDNALLAGFALQRRPVDADIVAEVCGDLEIGGRQRPAPSVESKEPPENPPSAPGETPASTVARWPRSAR